MRALKVEFLPATPSRVRLVLCALGCLGVSAYLVVRSWQAHHQIQLLDQQNLQISLEVNELEELATHSSLPSREATDQPPYYLDALKLAKTSAFPTQQVLITLERTHVAGVRISNIDIDQERGVVDVAIEFADMKALLQFVEVLNDGEPESKWQLVRAETGTGNKKPAQILARW